MPYQDIKLDPMGVNVDTNAHDVPVEQWTDVLNMRFKSSAAQKIGGESEGMATDVQANHILFNGNHNTPAWVLLGDATAWATDLSTDTDIEGTALTSGTNWDSCLFNLFPIVNNTVDSPQYWDNNYSNNLVVLPAFPTDATCTAIRPYRSFLIAMNVKLSGATVEPNRVLWSSSSDSGALPASWDIADPTVLAGDAYLTDDKGEIIDGGQLRDLFVIYKTHSTYVMRLIGGQSVMRIDKVQVNSGLLAKNCITEFKGRHFLVADGDIVLFDGQNIESIADKRVRKQIFDNIDSTYYAKTHVTRYDKENEIWINYPESGQSEVTKAAIWNWLDNTWTFRELTNTRYIASGLAEFVSPDQWNTVSGTWTSITGTWSPSFQNPTVDALVGANTLSLNVIDDTYDLEGVAMTSKLEKATMDLGEPDNVKMVKSVTPRITAAAGTKIYIRIGTQMHPDDAISWSSEVLYTVGTDREAHFHEKGRYISVRMRTQDIGSNWKCHGFYIKVKPSGKH